MNKKTRKKQKQTQKTESHFDFDIDTDIDDSPQELALRFSPTAWAKLLFFRDHGQTEIGGFGITPADDLLYIEDFVTVKQKVTSVSVSFDDEAVANLFDTVRLMYPVAV